MNAKEKSAREVLEDLAYDSHQKMCKPSELAREALSTLRDLVLAEKKEKSEYNPLDMHADRYNGIIEGYNSAIDTIAKKLE